MTAARFTLYGALYLLCSRWHSGQGSRGYRILSRLDIAGYRPGLSVRNGRCEDREMLACYAYLCRKYRHAL